MASIKDVAKLAGVGLGTVSRVLNENGYVSIDARARVHAAMRQLNYTPNYSAQSLKRQKTRLVGLFVPTINHPFFSRIAQYLENRFDEKGYKLMLVCSQGNAQKENSVINLIVQNRLDGAVFITHHRHDDIAPEYPLVTLDRHLDKAIPCITSDNFDSCYRAVKYLISRGCRKVGYLGGKPKVESEVEERLSGYRAAVKSCGMEESVLFEVIGHGDEAAYVKKFFESFPDADGALISGDMLAASAYHRAVALGKRIPEDFKFVSFDGVVDSWFAGLRFTCIRQDLEKLSDAIVEQLICKIEGTEYRQMTVVPTLFEEGETT